MKYFTAYDFEGGNFFIQIKAKNLAKAWKKIGKELKKEKVSMNKRKSESEDEKGIIVSEISKKYYKFLKED